MKKASMEQTKGDPVTEKKSRKTVENSDKEDDTPKLKLKSLVKKRGDSPTREPKEAEEEVEVESAEQNSNAEESDNEEDFDYMSEDKPNPRKKNLKKNKFDWQKYHREKKDSEKFIFTAVNTSSAQSLAHMIKTVQQEWDKYSELDESVENYSAFFPKEAEKLEDLLSLHSLEDKRSTKSKFKYWFNCLRDLVQEQQRGLEQESDIRAHIGKYDFFQQQQFLTGFTFSNLGKICGMLHKKFLIDPLLNDSKYRMLNYKLNYEKALKILRKTILKPLTGLMPR